MKRRWWLVALASFVVFFFEHLEYELYRRGISIRFVYEVFFNGVFLPVCVGLALTALSASRSELAWPNLVQQLSNKPS